MNCFVFQQKLVADLESASNSDKQTTSTDLNEKLAEIERLKSEIETLRKDNAVSSIRPSLELIFDPSTFLSLSHRLRVVSIFISDFATQSCRVKLVSSVKFDSKLN